MGQALTRTGDAVGRVALDAMEQANQVRVSDAANQLDKIKIDRQLNALSITGRAALERPDSKSLMDEEAEALSTQSKKIADGLGNDVQRMAFSKYANSLTAQYYGQIGSHVMQQSKQFAIDSDKDKAGTAYKTAGLLYGSPVEVANATAKVESVVQSTIARQGLDPTKDRDMIDSIRSGLMSPLYDAVITGFITSRDTTRAKDYFDAHSADMDLQTKVRLQDHIQKVDVLVRGEGAADDAWDKFKPANQNDPVRIYDMEQSIREQYKGDPAMKDAALRSLKERAATFNAQQSELNAGGINKVYGLIDSGMSLSRVQASPAWLALPEAKRHEITKGLESEAATRSARSASDSARALSELTRNDRLSLLHNGADYLHDSDPDVLTSKTRAEVEAMRPKYGFEGTQQLLQRFDLLGNKDAKIQARIDDTAFKAIVKDTLDIDPYGKLSSDSKAMLGNLKTRVDGMLQTEAQRLRRPLTTEEKSDLMRTEAAKTVTVNGLLWNSDKPAAALSPSDAANVVIPPAKKTQLLASMKKAYAATGDADYAPTKENLNRLYLKGVSPISGLPNAK